MSYQNYQGYQDDQEEEPVVYGGGGGGGGGDDGDLDPKEIYVFLDQHRQHSQRLAPTDPRAYGGAPVAAGEYSTAASYSSSYRSSEHSVSTTTAPSSRPTAVFDRSSAASITSDLTVERQELLPLDVVEDILAQAQADSIDTQYLLPCEFFHLTECNMVFRYDEVEYWIEHVLNSHLAHDDLPDMMLCWYCDSTTFEATDARDRRRNFRYRMYHIKEHIMREGKTVRDIRADFYFLRYLYQHGLISSAKYQAVSEYHEAPHAEGGMYELGWRPESLLWQEERRSAVVHDLDRQERRRHRHHGHRHRHGQGGRRH